jgi:hypothetical protein
MFRMLVILALVLSVLTPPALGQGTVALPYTLILSHALTSIFPSTAAIQQGSQFGGVPVQGSISGTTTSGTLTLTADGKNFAQGNYSCSSGGCFFSGTMAGKTIPNNLGLGQMSGLGTFSSTIKDSASGGAFRTQGDWNAAVNQWAQDNRAFGAVPPPVVAPAPTNRGQGTVALPYTLMLGHPLTSIFPSTAAIQQGSQFGGVPVQGSISGTSNSGTLTLTADGKNFAQGNYSCSSGGCFFSGTIAGKTIANNLGLGQMSGLRTSSNTIKDSASGGAFRTQGDWNAAVNQWAQDNRAFGAVPPSAVLLPQPCGEQKKLDQEKSDNH